MAFFYVHYVLIYQTVTSLTYVFVPLDFRPRYPVFLPNRQRSVLNGKGCPAIFSSSDNRVSRRPFLRPYSASISAAFLSAFCASFCRFSACSINDPASRGDIRNQHQQTTSGSLYATGGHHIRRFQYGIRAPAMHWVCLPFPRLPHWYILTLCKRYDIFVVIMIIILF